LLGEGVSIYYWPLAASTERGHVELLKKCFANGGDPNAKYKSGVALMGRISSEKWTPELLQVWLDAGANPTLTDSDSPWGDDWNPSALYQWVWLGRLDLIKQSILKALGPVPLSRKGETRETEGQTYSPLLLLAVIQDKVDIARWFIHEQGLSLDMLDEESGEPISKFASPETLAAIKA
jgi:hypothetical protein